MTRIINRVINRSAHTMASRPHHLGNMFTPLLIAMILALLLLTATMPFATTNPSPTTYAVTLICTISCVVTMTRIFQQNKLQKSQQPDLALPILLAGTYITIGITFLQIQFADTSIPIGITFLQIQSINLIPDLAINIMGMVTFAMAFWYALAGTAITITARRIQARR